MVRQLIQKVESNATSEGINIQLAKVGRYLKRLYTKYGGHPDA